MEVAMLLLVLCRSVTLPQSGGWYYRVHAVHAIIMLWRVPLLHHNDTHDTATAGTCCACVCMGPCLLGGAESFAGADAGAGYVQDSHCMCTHTTGAAGG